MRSGVLAVACVALAACAPPTKTDRACARASELRGEGRQLAAEGRLSRSLALLEEANVQCPSSRPESWGTEVRLLAQLGRCADAAALADAIDGAAWRGDGAWLSGAVARHECAAASSLQPGALFDEGEERSRAGDHAGARRAFERAFAASRQRPRADFIRWTHKVPGPIAWLGRDLVIVADQRRASVFRANDWRERMSLDAHGLIRWVATSPDGRLAATSDDDEIKIWDIDRRTLRAEVHGRGPLALSDDTLAFVRGRAVLTMDTGTGRQEGSLPVDGPVTMARMARGFAVAGDRRVVFFDDDGRELRSLPVTPATVASLSPRPAVRNGTSLDLDAVHAVVSPDGATVLYRDLAGLHCFDAATKTDRVVVPTVTAPVEDIAVLAGGDAIAVRAVDLPGGHIWTASGPTRVAALDAPGWQFGGGLVMPTQHDGTFAVLDALTGAPLRHGTLDPSDEVRMSADGSRVLFAHDGRFRFVAVREDAPDTTTFLGGESPVGFDPSDSSVVITHDASTLRWRAAPSFALLRSRKLDVFGATRLLDGEGEPAVVMTSTDKERIVSLVTGRVLLEDKPLSDVSLVRRADGSFLRAGRQFGESSRAPFHVYDPAGNSTAMFTPYAHECESFDMPPDGRWVAAGCKEGSIVVWSTETYETILVLRPFPGLDSGYALEPATGRVEIFGDPPLEPVCRAGARSVPFEACDEVVEPGLVARVLGGARAQ